MEVYILTGMCNLYNNEKSIIFKFAGLFRLVNVLVQQVVTNAVRVNEENK